jgi:hypothetical protein
MIVEFYTGAGTTGEFHKMIARVTAFDAQGNMRVFKSRIENLGFLWYATSTAYQVIPIVNDDGSFEILLESGNSASNQNPINGELIDITEVLEEVYEICS